MPNDKSPSSGDGNLGKSFDKIRSCRWSWQVTQNSHESRNAADPEYALFDFNRLHLYSP